MLTNRTSFPPSLADLPEPLARAARVTWVPPHVRALFAHLPRPIDLALELPAGAATLPLSARQLVKIALLVPQLRLARVTVAAEPTAPLRVALALDARRCAFDAAALGARTVAALAHDTLAALLEPDEAARVLETFAMESATLGTLQRLTNHMLQSTDVDQTLNVMLLGVTSGQGLGFNRAALFLYDPARALFTGARAIGPHDEREAHRIWEAIEYEDKSIDELLADTARPEFDTRLQQFVQTLVLAPGAGGELDEVARAQHAEAPVLFRGPAHNPGLAALGARGEFVLAAIRPHGTLLGMVFADELYTATPVTPVRLGFLGFYTDQTALLWENLLLLRRAEELARYDGLTQVHNRREFESRFALEQSRLLRGHAHARCALLLIDVDHFKSVNDTHGHAAGDAMLRRVGAILRGALRAHDTAARYGGDEFVVLLPDASGDDAARVAERVADLARAEGISLSIGGAAFPDGCAEPAGLLPAADANLYAAKRAGRGRVRIERGAE